MMFDNFLPGLDILIFATVVWIIYRNKINHPVRFWIYSALISYGIKFTISILVINIPSRELLFLFLYTRFAVWLFLSILVIYWFAKKYYQVDINPSTEVQQSDPEWIQKRFIKNVNVALLLGMAPLILFYALYLYGCLVKDGQCTAEGIGGFAVVKAMDLFVPCVLIYIGASLYLTKIIIFNYKQLNRKNIQYIIYYILVSIVGITEWIVYDLEHIRGAVEWLY